MFPGGERIRLEEEVLVLGGIGHLCWYINNFRPSIDAERCVRCEAEAQGRYCAKNADAHTLVQIYQLSGSCASMMNIWV